MKIYVKSYYFLMELNEQMLYLCFILSLKYIEIYINNQIPNNTIIRAPFSITYNILFLGESLQTIEYINYLIENNLLKNPSHITNLTLKLTNTLITHEFITSSTETNNNPIISKSFSKIELLVISGLGATLLLICYIND